MRDANGKNAESAGSIEIWEKDNRARVFVVELGVADSASVEKGVAEAIDKKRGEFMPMYG